MKTLFAVLFSLVATMAAGQAFPPEPSGGGGGGATYDGGSVTNPFLAPSGTKTLPGFAFTADPDTGIFQEAATEINISIDDTEMVEIRRPATNPSVFFLNPLNVGGSNAGWSFQSSSTSASINMSTPGELAPDYLAACTTTAGCYVQLQDLTNGNYFKLMDVDNTTGGVRFSNAAETNYTDLVAAAPSGTNVVTVPALTGTVALMGASNLGTGTTFQELSILAGGGVLYVDDGSAAAPGLASVLDAGTGFQLDTNGIQASVGGTAYWITEADGDFRPLAADLELGVATAPWGNLHLSGGAQFWDSGASNSIEIVGDATLTVSYTQNLQDDDGDIALLVTNGLTTFALPTVYDANDVGVVNSVWGGTNSLIFEGSTADNYEIILTPENPTAVDKTLTLPAETGTLMSQQFGTSTLTDNTATDILSFPLTSLDFIAGTLSTVTTCIDASNTIVRHDTSDFICTNAADTESCAFQTALGTALTLDDGAGTIVTHSLGVSTAGTNTVTMTLQADCSYATITTLESAWEIVFHQPNWELVTEQN